MSQQWALVGLGNPGTEYALTRHNVGFWALDSLLSKLRAPALKSKGGCEFAKATSPNGEDLYLIRPIKFMNRSGEAAAPLISFFKIEPGQVVVFQDDVDLESGALKIKLGGGSGGQHGIEDLARHLPSKEFYRVRIGIGRPPGSRPGEDLSSWVLGKARGEELQRLKETADLAAESALLLVAEGLDKASQKFSRRAFPQPR